MMRNWNLSSPWSPLSIVGTTLMRNWNRFPPPNPPPLLTKVKIFMHAIVNNPSKIITPDGLYCTLPIVQFQILLQRSLYISFQSQNQSYFDRMKQQKVALRGNHLVCFFYHKLFIFIQIKEIWYIYTRVRVFRENEKLEFYLLLFTTVDPCGPYISKTTASFNGLGG